MKIPPRAGLPVRGGKVLRERIPLEVDTQTELHGARRRELRTRLASKRCRTADGQRRVAGIQVVEDVGELEEQRCTNAILAPQRKVLSNGRIHVPNSQSTEVGVSAATGVVTQDAGAERL